MMNRRARFLVVMASVLLSAMVLPMRAHAQTGQAAAQALFDQARELMKQGRYADACPKLADSQRLDPGAGTLLNLANCYEKNGQSASAWVTYKDAAAAGKQSGHPDWEARARERSVALEPTLSRLTISVPPGSEVEGIQITRDGVTIAHAEWGVPIPVDPGAHVVEATAPKTRKWNTTVNVAANGARASVTIPALDVEQNQVPPPVAPVTPSTTTITTPPPAGAEPRSGGTQRIVGFIVGGVGVVGVGLGTVFGLSAKSKNNEALQPNNCRTATLCSPSGLALTDDAKSAATLSTVMFVAGGAALATGIVLILTAPSDAARPTQAATKSSGIKAAHLSVVPAVGPGTLGMAMGGAW